MNLKVVSVSIAAASVAMLLAVSAAAQEDCDEQCQAARKAQDPLADARAIMTDNTISFGTADNQTG